MGLPWIVQGDVCRHHRVSEVFLLEGPGFPGPWAFGVWS